MRARTIIVIFIAWAGLSLLGSPAAAQDADLSRAEKHFNSAQALFGKGQYQEAAAEFRAAYDVRPLPPLLYNIGACYEKLAKANPAEIGHWDQAIEHYRRYLKDEPKAADRQAIESRIGVLEAERDRIKLAIANKPTDQRPAQLTTSSEVAALADVKIRGLVLIESDPPGAFIYLDDKKKTPLGQTPWSGTLEGEHTVFIEREGYKPRERQISPSPDRLIILSFALSEEEFLGWIDITSNVPGAAIYLDDKKVGVYRKTPFSGNLPPGKHKIWITADGYDEHYEEIEILAGKSHAIEAKLRGAPVGYLHVSGREIEYASVYLDGKLLCERGPCRKPVKEGKHELAIQRPGYKTYRRTVDVQAKTELGVRTRLVKKQGRGDAIWAYAFAAAFAGGGLYLGYQAQDLRDQLRAEIDAGMPPPDSNDPRFLHGKLYAAGADLAYGLAGITFVTAIYYTFRDKGPSSVGATEVKAVSVSPQAAPGYAGIGMEVRW